jgi:hypothetical protein
MVKVSSLDSCVQNVYARSFALRLAAELMQTQKSVEAYLYGKVQRSYDAFKVRVRVHFDRLLLVVSTGLALSISN